jgi:hypothetical protein
MQELLGYWIAVKSLKETLYVNDLCIVLPVVAEMGGIDEVRDCKKEEGGKNFVRCSSWVTV